MKNNNDFIRDIKAINNWKIYKTTIFISLLLILLPLIDETCNILTIISGIGCSGLAAAVMAMFIDLKHDEDEERRIEDEARIEKSRIKVARSKYLSGLYADLIELTGRFLWMYEHIEDDWFGWGYINSEYFFTEEHDKCISPDKFNFIADQRITFSDAIDKLRMVEDFGDSTCSARIFDIQNRVLITFEALYSVSSNLIREIIQLKNDMLYLDAEGYLSFKDSETLYTQLTGAINYLNATPPRISSFTYALLSVLEWFNYYSEQKDPFIIIGRHTIFRRVSLKINERY